MENQLYNRGDIDEKYTKLLYQQLIQGMYLQNVNMNY